MLGGQGLGMFPGLGFEDLIRAVKISGVIGLLGVGAACVFGFRI